MTAAVLEIRGNRLSDPDPFVSSLLRFRFDRGHEERRRKQLNKQLRRAPSEELEEERLIKEQRQIDKELKRLQKELKQVGVAGGWDIRAGARRGMPVELSSPRRNLTPTHPSVPTTASRRSTASPSGPPPAPPTSSTSSARRPAPAAAGRCRRWTQGRRAPCGAQCTSVHAASSPPLRPARAVSSLRRCWRRSASSSPSLACPSSRSPPAPCWMHTTG